MGQNKEKKIISAPSQCFVSNTRDSSLSWRASPRLAAPGAARYTSGFTQGQRVPCSGGREEKPKAVKGVQ